MKFSVDQTASVAPAAAAAAYGNPAFYEGRAPRDNISVLGVVSHDVTEGRILIEVRFQFTGSVSSAVRAVIDPKKMSWVTRTEVRPDELRSTFEVLPDHYPDRLKSRGAFDFTPGSNGPDGTVVNVSGELKVRVPLVGGTVERVIVAGLRSYIAHEVSSLTDFVAG
jgi:hypothetical protein